MAGALGAQNPGELGWERDGEGGEKKEEHKGSLGLAFIGTEEERGGRTMAHQTPGARHCAGAVFAAREEGDRTGVGSGVTGN